MKRIKWAFIALALLAAVGIAFSKAPCFNCIYQPQYYFDGTNYMPAGRFGYDYVCVDEPGVCTYYKPNPMFQPNYYVLCREGEYLSGFLRTKK